MKRISLETRHLRSIAVPQLAIAACTGGFLTLLFGMWVVPYICMSMIEQWSIHHLLWWEQVSGLASFFTVPNLPLGFIWLLYYLLSYYWATATLSPRQKMALQKSRTNEHDKASDEWVFPHDSDDPNTYEAAPSKQQDHPLSRAWPGELKHQLVERCYQQYRNALKRYDPAPINLQTPDTFCYRKEGRLEWIDNTTLLLPEEILTPERIHELLPFLAHYLAYYNMRETRTAKKGSYPDHVPLPLIQFLTGNFLWLSVVWKHQREKTEVSSTVQQVQAILKADKFAFYLGQGPALEHQLRRIEGALKRNDQIDSSEPPLIERIGQLEVLNEQERQQMRAFGLQPQDQSPLLESTQRAQISSPHSNSRDE